MINIGVGNAGCTMLWRHYDYLRRTPALEKDMNNLASLPTVHKHRYIVGDADNNNSIIHVISNIEKLDTKYPPDRIDVLHLDRYWSGGCGVYHVLGEL
jgi:hypothetical protein